MRELPKRALVLGLARSGRAAALALARRGVEVVGVDHATAAALAELREAGVDVRLGDEAETLPSGIELIVKSPGVPAEARLLGVARENGIAVWSELELGFRLLPDNPLLAVTGTNGKTTTSEWLGFMLGVPVAGNVGRALCDLDGQVRSGQLVVVEVSSFQLEDVDRFRPRIAVLLNLEPDHLDRHGSYEAYRAVKLRVFENQSPGDTAVVPLGFDAVPGEARRVEFDAADSLPAQPSLRGVHNRENAAAATAAARAAGAGDDAIARGLQQFRGVPHRLELVADSKGVRYINDSKATNVAAATRALAAYEDEPVHLILGGSRKNEDFAPLTAAIGPNVKGVYVIGETAEELAAVLPRAVRAGDLATALRLIEAVPGDVVLFSPACASYDQFRDFEHRGEEFRRLVQNLSG